MASSASQLTTVADMQNILRKDWFRYELRRGHIVEVPPAPVEYQKIGNTLRRLIRQVSDAEFEMVDAMPAFTIGEHDYRVVSVAFVLADRRATENAVCNGAPDLVIDIAEPATPLMSIHEKRNLCLNNGSREFWLIDPAHKEISVTRPTWRGQMYQSGDRIPLFFAPESALAVDAIFEG